MLVFTYTRVTQWSYEFYQVLAETEKQARMILQDNHGFLSLVSCFQTTETDSKIVLSVQYDNESYEG